METIEVYDEDSFMAAMSLVDEGPVSYSDKYRFVARVDDPEELFQLIVQASKKQLVATVTTLAARPSSGFK